MATDSSSTDSGPSAGAVLSIGLTGSIASGKSSVAKMLSEFGAAVIDSDALAREATEDPQVLEQIEEEFGEQVVVEGRLDRKALASLVFADSGGADSREARRRLEAIIHPWVRARSERLQRQLLESAQPPPAIVHDIPLLIENGLQEDFDAVVVVVASAEVRAARAAKRSNLSDAEFRARDSAQLPEERKAELADHVIDNSGDLDALAPQVARLWKKLGLGETGQSHG